MAGSDSSSWKLLIYPLIILMVLGASITFFIKPFVDAGIPAPTNPNAIIGYLSNVVYNGDPYQFIPSNTNDTEVTLGSIFGFGLKIILFPVFGLEGSIYRFIVPEPMRAFLREEVNAISYLPEVIQKIIIIIFVACFGYLLFVLATMLIPH